MLFKRKSWRGKRKEAANEHQWRRTSSLHLLFHLLQVPSHYFFPVRKKTVKVGWQIHPCCCGCEETALPLWLLWWQSNVGPGQVLWAFYKEMECISLCWVCQGFAHLNVFSLEEINEFLSVNKGEQGLEVGLCGRELCSHEIAWFSVCILGVWCFSVSRLGLELVFKLQCPDILKRYFQYETLLLVRPL